MLGRNLGLLELEGSLRILGGSLLVAQCVIVLGGHGGLGHDLLLDALQILGSIFVLGGLKSFFLKF